MEKIKEEGLVIFNDTHVAIKTDNICKEEGINASLIPVHPSITKGCGFMMRINWSDFNILIKFLQKKGIQYKELYYSKKIGIKRELEKLDNFEIK